MHVNMSTCISPSFSFSSFLHHSVLFLFISLTFLCFLAFFSPLLSFPLCALMWRLNLTLLDDITLCCLLACLPAWGL